MQFDTANNPLFVGDAYGTFDLYTGIAAKDGRYRLQFYVLNLLDKFNTATIGGQTTVGIEAAHALPYTYKRRFGVSLQMDWQHLLAHWRCDIGACPAWPPSRL